MNARECARAGVPPGPAASAPGCENRSTGPVAEAASARKTVDIEVNGARHVVAAAPSTSLLTVLRNDLGLNGPKYGCGLGQCGACTVLVDGVAARACVIPVGRIRGRRITTLEGLGTREHPHPVQQAFIDEQAAQCGYCLNGMIMSTVALLEGEASPDDARIRAALSGNLCRCGTHLEIIRAVRRAATLLRARSERREATASATVQPAELATDPA